MDQINSILISLGNAKSGFRVCSRVYISLPDLTALHVLTLDPAIENSLQRSIREADFGSSLVIEPKYAEQLLSRLAVQADRIMKGNMLPVLLCSPDLRRHIRTLSERVIPHMRILSMAEIPNTVNLKSFSMVHMD